METLARKKQLGHYICNPLFDDPLLHGVPFEVIYFLRYQGLDARRPKYFKVHSIVRVVPPSKTKAVLC